MKLVTHLKIQSSHLALVVALVIGIAFTDRLHAQAAPAPISENPTAILINNARIFDGTSDELVAGNLLIVGSKIKQIGSGVITAPPGCQVIDASGWVLMPGLTDASLAYDNGPEYLG